MGLFAELFGTKRTEEGLIVPKEDNSHVDKSTKDDETFINERGEVEYKVIEREISPEKIICPDCGGITLEGLEYCDKCGGELM